MQIGDFVLPDAFTGNVTTQTVPTGVTPDNSGWMQTFADLAKMGLSVYQQIQLQNMQMDLIKRGLPPMSAAQLASMAPQVNIGVASETQKLLMYGGIGLLGILLLSTMNKGRAH